MTFLPHGIGIGLSKTIDLADWSRVRQGEEQLQIERENLELSQLREKRAQEQADREKREADWLYYSEAIQRPGQILSPRLEEDYVKTVFDPTITEMGQMWTSNMGIRDKTDYTALTEFEKKSNLLMNNPILADASYLQKQKDAYEKYKTENGQDQYTRYFEQELDAFENRNISTPPTFMPYRFNAVDMINSIKDNIQIDYQKGQKVGEYIEMEGVYNPDALVGAAAELYNKDPKGWENYFKGDPYAVGHPIESIGRKIEQFTALDSKWLPAYNSSGSGSGGGTTKTPMRNMLLDYITNPDFYNSKKQQSSKTAILAPHGDLESFDGQVMPHLTFSQGNNFFAVEVPENAVKNAGTVQQLELPTDLNARIISGNGLRFYDGSEEGAPPQEQNVYTGVRVEVYAPTTQTTAVTGTKITKTDPLEEFMRNCEEIGLSPTRKQYTVATASAPGGTGTRQVQTAVIDLVVPVDWSNASAFNEQFMTQTQAAEVNTAFGAITAQNFDLPVIGVMTDANVDYDVAGTFLASYAAAKGYGEDLQKAATELRKEYRTYNDKQPATKKITFEEYFALNLQ